MTYTKATAKKREVLLSSNISRKKWTRIRKKVLSHLAKSQRFLLSGKPKRAQDELNIAVKNLRLEKVKPNEVLRDIAGLYNNIGAEYAKNDVAKAFSMFSRSLEIKKELHLQLDPESLKGTLRSFILTGIIVCEFERVLEKIEEIRDIFKEDLEFSKYLEQQPKIIDKITKNEPEILICGASLASKTLVQPLPSGVYLPKLFSQLVAHVDKCDLRFLDFETLLCTIEFTVKSRDGTIAQIENPYSEDPWKIELPEELKPKIEHLSPNLIVFLDNYEHIPRTTIELVDAFERQLPCEVKTVFSEFFIPESYPRFGYSFLEKNIIPKCKEFMFFRGRAKVFEWRLKLGERYRVEFHIKTYHEHKKTRTKKCPSLQSTVGILIPFKFAEFNKLETFSTKGIAVGKIMLKPIKYFKEHKGAKTIVLKEEPKSLDAKSMTDGEEFEKVGALHYSTRNSALVLDDYRLLGFNLEYSLSEGEFSVSTRIWEQPIPIGIYHLIMDKKFGFPPLVTYVVMNNSDTEVKLTFSTKLCSISYEEQTQASILPRSIERIEQTPTMDPKKTVEIVETCIADLACQVALQQQKLLVQTHKMRLLSYDTMIWEIIDPSSGTIFNLSDFLAAWVTPHTKGLEIEKLVQRAKELHPQKTLKGYQGSSQTVEEMERITGEQCKALFQALKLRYTLSYVDSSISFGWYERFKSQRIKLPSVTLQTGSANCVDSSVLLASALEHIGIDPVIVLIPSHAFLGWKIRAGSDVYTFLETTMIGYASFEEATTRGRDELLESLQKAKIRINNPRLSLDDAVKMGLIRFIDIQEMRTIGVLPMNI